MNQNPYEILHLEEDATYEEIKERYRHLTRYLHPDKQPLENYQMAKKHFQLIDSAYKAISSPLRRFVYREYGLDALRILDEFRLEFEEFDEQKLSKRQEEKLRQLMKYMIHEQHASSETDKSKFVSKTMINISKLLKEHHQGKAQLKINSSKQRSRIPELDNCIIEYEMTLPQLFQFQNTLGIHQISTFKNDVKSYLSFGTLSQRRIFFNWILAAQSTISENQTNFQVNVQRICENNLHLKLTPLSISNWELQRPKIGVEKSFNNFHCATMFDLKSWSFQISEPNKKKFSKSFQLYLKAHEIELIPKVQYNLSQSLKLVSQVHLHIESKSQTEYSIKFILNYGYKLKLTDEIKIQLTSTIGSQNYFQISLASTKFRASFPLYYQFTNQNAYKYQLYKMAVFITTYLAFEIYRHIKTRNQKIKEQKIKEQMSRLNQQKRDLHRAISYVEMVVKQNIEREIKYNGLVLIRSYIGDYHNLAQIQKAIKVKQKAFSKRFGSKAQSPYDVIQFYSEKVQELVENKTISIGSLRDELEDVTDLLQAEIQGGQLLRYQLEKLKKYNPIIFEKDVYILILVYERGLVNVQIKKCSGYLNLGGLSEKYSQGLSFETIQSTFWKVLDWLI